MMSEIPLYPDSIEEPDWECKNCNQKTLHIIQKGNLFDGNCSNCGWYCFNQIPEIYLRKPSENSVDFTEHLTNHIKSDPIFSDGTIHYEDVISLYQDWKK